MTSSHFNRGAIFAMIAAALFGASTPAAKLLLGEIDPWLLAGLLYLGSGLGLLFIYIGTLVLSQTPAQEASLTRKDWPWLGLATLFGGVLGPVALMSGLMRTDAASSSLLLNLESVFTALLAWFVFKENFDKRIAIGMIAIFSGSLVLSWTGEPRLGSFIGPLCIALACLCWAIDNNFTRKISASHPVQIVMVKGLIAGSVNVGLALLLGQHLPSWNAGAIAGVIGLFGYGLSLFFFVLALRHIGTARTGAYFALAPFVGAILSLIFVDGTLSIQLVMAAFLMGLGVWLHLTEKHEHEHEHEEMSHGHKHVHDEHHQHAHSPNDPVGEPHTHWHKHERLRHSHPHYPDIHHRHSH